MTSPAVQTAESSHGAVRRLGFVVGCLFLGWLAVSIRLIGIVISEQETMQDRVENQQTTAAVIRARPGDILDRRGRLLATSIDQYSLFAVPNQIEDVATFSDQVAAVLDRDAEKLAAKLKQHRDKGFVWLERRLEAATAEKIRALKLPPQSYGFEREFKRHYPHGELAAHLLGLRNIDGEGRGGIEQTYHRQIRGVDGQRILVRDARNRIAHLYEDPQRPVEQGKTVRLTIDLKWQQVVERELDRVMEEWQPTGCTAMLCQPQTGEMIAMASRPTYHPDRPETFADEAWMNRAVSWTYEPGSTMKPLIVAWAMQQNLVSPNTVLFGHWGEYRMGPRLLHDTHPYGELTLADVLVNSSNIGMAQIGEKLTNRGLFAAVNQFGFGYSTGTGLPGELSGFVRPLADWNLYSTGSIPMGQELTVTPLQMIAAHAALANRGIYQPPKLVLEVGKENVAASARVEMPIVDPNLCDWIIREPMAGVMSRGTGRRAKLPGRTLFGKTGTSQVYDPEAGGYSNEKSVCSFVCGLPPHNPEWLVLVVVDQPTAGTGHYGGTVAGPPAVRILDAVSQPQPAQLASPALPAIR